MTTAQATPDTDADLGIFEADTTPKGIASVYELGYHLLSTLSAQEAAAAAKDITAFLKKHKADFVGEGTPEACDLAYSIQKRIGGKLTTFTTSFFGWTAFEIDRDEMADIKKFLDTHPSILRYLLVSTTKDEVAAVLEGAVIMPTAAASTAAIGPSKTVKEESGSVSDADLSAALDTMTAEDKKAE